MRIVFLTAAVWAASLVPLAAKDENGMRVEVSRSTVSNDDERGSGYSLSRVERTMALKVLAKNISLKPFDVGQLEWTMIVERWGVSGSSKYERYKGTENFPPLKPGESSTLTVGQSSIGGYSFSRNYQDKLEAWKVIIRHAGADTITLVSGTAFERLNSKARDAEKESP